MTARSTFIPIQATEQLVDALNSAVELDGGAASRIDFLLHRLQGLLNRPTRCALWLIDELTRQPAPRITFRTVVLPSVDDSPLGSIEDAQHAIDQSAPLSTVMVESVLANIRTPVTLIVSQGAPKEWFDSVLVPNHLKPMGYADCIASMWAATDNLAIFLIVHRRDTDPAFTEKDCDLVSLMLRAAAPIVDREIFRRTLPVPHEDLSDREREVLLLLLAGDSEKEIANALSRSIHTVHTFVRQLYRHFNVSSRGELMALFVDKAVLATIREDLPA
jgi:DNA-binding CsgD family transcriptional regulator